jgi:hypothetical protein
MPTYVDVGAVRIQEYILRTSGSDESPLRKRRGASQLITAATDPAAFAGLGLRRNDETYTVEGVAHLVVDDDAQVQVSPSELTERALLQVRASLPAAHLEGSWATAPTYREARSLIETARRSPGQPALRAGVLLALPPTRDDPYAPTCRSCGVGTVETPSAGMCRDCQARDAQGVRGGVETPETRACAAVGKALGQQLSPVRDLGQLAQLPTAPDSKLNHLAAVYADGNGVGALFKEIPHQTATLVSTAIDAAIRDAGTHALCSIQPKCRPGVLPGVVTALAADDALVTVPATLAWPFATSLVTRFNALMSADPKVGSALGGLPAPSLTAGIAFFPVKSPIESAIQSAFASMKLAKRTFYSQPALGWVDHTHPSEDGLTCRTVEWFNQQASTFNELAAVPGSQRAKWEAYLLAARTEGVQPERLLTFLRADARRGGYSVLDGVTTTDLAALLAASRWWSR